MTRIAFPQVSNNMFPLFPSSETSLELPLLSVFLADAFETLLVYTQPKVTSTHLGTYYSSKPLSWKTKICVSLGSSEKEKLCVEV